MSSFIIKGLTVYEETTTLEDGLLFIRDGKMEWVGKEAEWGDIDSNVTVYDFSNPEYKLIPGMIDIHIHGVNGADMMDSSYRALETIAATLPKEGTTSFLAATITQSEKAISDALTNVSNYMKEGHAGAEIIGVHLEGPFINREKAGAQPVEHIITPSVHLFDRWQEKADSLIKIVTLAPEQESGMELVSHVASQGVIVSIGHSDATFETVNEAIERGATHVTHLYNQMSGLHHRKPGIVGAALANDDLFVEIICDGIHVHPEVVKATYNVKGAERVLVITDSMRAKWLEDGVYDLGGQEVKVVGETALLSDGTLAGSVLKMDSAFRNVMAYTGCTLREAIKMTSENQAKQLRIFDEKGSIRVGKDADIVILDEENNVVMTFCRGNVSYERGKNE